MHIPPQFRVDRASALAFASARGFGLICACDGGRPVASWAPFHLAYAEDGTPMASFHLARSNPLTAPYLAGQSWMIAVGGADAYISPRWYASPQQVPTWLYEAVQLQGPAQPLSGAGLAAHLDAVSAHFEGVAEGQAPATLPWTVAEIAPGRRNALMNAIVGFEMRIESVQGSFKLNQHKSDADHLAITEALARQPDAGAQQIAKDMRAMRPHVFSNVFTSSNQPDIGTAVQEGIM